jgi:hypothetical protein
MSRRYIRHPSEIPIEILLAGQAEMHQMTNISLGGLCVQTHHCLPDNAEITIRIPLLMPQFSANGRVRWCHYRTAEDALLGICFGDHETAFAVRMVEQICHIESYRRRASRLTGINYSSEAAALEWIARYAQHFTGGPN